MHSILIVDDEKIIRDGVCELLSMEEEFELDIISAASVLQAREILETRRVDIVMTDINMPQISGLEFFNMLLERWPYCKVIFLTGYSEFDYVYKVQQRARYVLKADGDEKIIDAVRETIEEIDNDLYLDQAIHDSKALSQVRNEAGQQLLLGGIISGHISPDELTQDLADKLEIPLRVDENVFYIVMYHRFRTANSYEKRLMLNDQLFDIAGRYYYGQMRGICIRYTFNFGLLLLQGNKTQTAAGSAALLQGNGELLQRAYGKSIDGSVSLYIGSRPIPLDEVINRFHVLRSELLTYDDEVILTDEYAPVYGEDGRQKNNIQYSRVQLIDFYFENNDYDGIVAIIKEAKAMYEGTQSMHDLAVISIYTSIASKLIEYTNQVGLSQEMCFRIGIANLYNLNLHDSWSEAFEYLVSIAGAIFELRLSKTEKQNTDVILRVKEYMLEHLDQDISLTAISGYIGLSPEHLARLFKKREGTTILQYINGLKIVKAKNLLSNKSRPIKDIAQALGFTSAGYFGRFFKSKTGMPPQQWRDSH